VYKTLGVKWLNQSPCPASAFVSVDNDEARNPQRFIHVTVMRKLYLISEGPDNPILKSWYNIEQNIKNYE